MSKRKSEYAHGGRPYTTIAPAQLRILAKPQYMPRTPRGPPGGFRKGYDRTSGFYGRYAPVNPSSAEMKFHDVSIDQDPISSSGNIMNGGTVIIIPQGVGESQRVGRKCTIKSINWRFALKLPELNAVVSPGPGDVIRVILYLDKQCNGATATVTDILQAAQYQAFNNLSNKTRFRTLMDRTIILNYQTLSVISDVTTMNQANVVTQESFFKKCNIPIEYSATTGAITEIASNNIGVLVIARNSLSVLDSEIRLRFHDY